MKHFYVIGWQDGDMATCKLGFTGDIPRRLVQLQVGNPTKLYLFATSLVSNAVRFEKFVHKAYSDKRIRGEWYRLGWSDLQLLYDNMDNAKQECSCNEC